MEGDATWGGSTVFWILRARSYFSWIESALYTDILHDYWSKWFCYAWLKIFNAHRDRALPVAILHFEAAQSSLGNSNCAVSLYFHIAEFKWAEGMAGPSINGNWCMLGYHVWSLCKGKFTNSGKLATCWGWWCSGQTSIQGCSGPLGKCRSKQWMLGLLGPSQLELVSSLASSSCCLWLHIFRACWPHKMLSKHSGCVRHTYSLQLWFSGLYTFVTSWLNVVLLKTACWALLSQDPPTTSALCDNTFCHWSFLMIWWQSTNFRWHGRGWKLSLYVYSVSLYVYSVRISLYVYSVRRGAFRN